MKRYGETITVIRPERYEGPVCPCGNFLCRPADDPYCPRSAIYCGKRGAGNYGGVPARAALTEKDELFAKWDAMAEYRRSEARAKVGGRGSSGDTTPAMPESVGDQFLSPAGPPRCIENIPTKGKRLAHQCRNRAKYGQYCGAHAKRGDASCSSENFPEALVEQPDPFSW